MTDILDVEFTHLGRRFLTDCDTFRTLFEVLGTEAERLIMAAGLQNGKIKEVIVNDATER